MDIRAESQKERAAISLDIYPDIKEAYSLTHSLRIIFTTSTIKDAARMLLARCYDKVDNSGFKNFIVIAGTLYKHYDETLSLFTNMATNASIESFNLKIKQFRAQLRRVVDIKFYFFRLRKLYA